LRPSGDSIDRPTEEEVEVDEKPTEGKLSDEDMRTEMGGGMRAEQTMPRDMDGTDTQDEGGTDTEDQDGTDEEDMDGTDAQDTDGTDTKDADGTDQ
jgi:hypothetical protein